MQFRVTQISEILGPDGNPLNPAKYQMTLRQLDAPNTSVGINGTQVVIDDSTAYEVGSTYDMELTVPA